MEMTTAFWYTAGLVGLLLTLQLLARPLELLLKTLGNGIIGGVALWVFNLVAGWFGYHLALNPVSAMIVGMLGVPGLISLGLLQWILS